MLACGAASAQAASISLKMSPDPAEDRPLSITASGTADKTSYVSAVLRASGGAPCADTYSSDVKGRPIFETRSVSTGNYSVDTRFSLDDPGSYLICAWLRTNDNAGTARTSLTVEVRSNHATLAFEAPPSAFPDQPFVITARGATEINRYLRAIVKPAGGAGCGSSYSTDTGGSRFFDGTDIQGAFAEQRSLTLDAGNYLLCGWIEEGSGDLQPEAVTSATISVQPPDGDGDGVPDATDRCPTRPGPGSSTGCPPRVAPASFTARATPKRDRTRPYKFRFSGSVGAPAGIAPGDACRGQVAVTVKRGRKTISSRRRTVRPDCTWSSGVSFRTRGRVGRNGRLRVQTRFLGNDVLTPKSAKTVAVRAR